MSITSLTCHHSQSLLSPFCRYPCRTDLPADIPLSWNRNRHWGKAEPTLTAASHLHKLLASLWQERCPIPTIPAVVLSLSQLSGAAKPQQTHKMLVAVTSQECPDIWPFSPLWCLLPANLSQPMGTFPAPGPHKELEPVQGSSHELRRDARVDSHQQGEYMNIMFQLNCRQNTYSHVSPGQQSSWSRKTGARTTLKALSIKLTFFGLGLQVGNNSVNVLSCPLLAVIVPCTHICCAAPN